MKSKTFNVKIQLTEDMLGTAPDPAVYSLYIATKAPAGTDTQDEVETLAELEERGITRFHADENGLFIYNYMIVGFLKSAANCLKEQLAIKALKSKIENFVFVSPRKITLGKTAPDGVLERAKQLQTAQGPRTALGKSEKVNAGLILTFQIKILDHKEVDEKVIQDLLAYGELKGLGQWRGGGYGAFEVLSFEEIK